MLSSFDLIVFSDDWGRHPFSCQHIMKHFLPTNRILWVNTIGMRNPRFTAYDIRRSAQKIRGWFKPSTEGLFPLLQNLKIINPVMTPFQNIPIVRSLNKSSVVSTVRKEMKELNMTNPVLLTTLPNAGDYAGEFSELAIIYYCVDDFTQWPGVDKKYITELEENILMKSDFVCASAEELCQIKTRMDRRPMLLPHGVDFDHFSTAKACTDINYLNIPHPIIGFFGAISPWLDFDLLYKLAYSRSDWSFVFIGPSDVDVSRLASLNNVHFIGKIPYENLSAYSSSFDVAIIPFLVNELTVSVNPLKLMEYLACGLPVISTRLPEVEKYRDIVYLADSAVEFEQKIELALSDKSDSKRLQRLEVARRNSWGAVAESLSNKIEEIISQKKKSNLILEKD